MHEHRWHFLQVRTEIVPATDYIYSQEDKEHRTLFDKVEYAYYVCNDCPDTDNEPNTIKRIVVKHDRPKA